MATNSSTEQCLQLIREMENMVAGARRGLSAETCVISRRELQSRLEQLNTMLPGSMKLAADYVKNISLIEQEANQASETVRRDALQTARKTTDEANARAEAILTDARRSAEEMTARAQSEAEAMVTAARQQAQYILEDANNRAAAMVDQEEIVRRARVEASEACEAAKQEMAQLRANTFDYLGDVMDHVDRTMSGLLNDLRMERSELNNHR